MSEQFETLFKNLANGMSRRAALRRLFAGIAGTAMFALTGRRAGADEESVCAQWCANEYRDHGPGWWPHASTRHSFANPAGAQRSSTFVGPDRTMARR